MQPNAQGTPLTNQLQAGENNSTPTLSTRPGSFSSAGSLKKALVAWLLEAPGAPRTSASNLLTLLAFPLKEAAGSSGADGFDEFDPPHAGRRLAGGCPASSLMTAMSTADTCEITAVQRDDRGSQAGMDTGLLEFLTIGECACDSEDVETCRVVVCSYV